MKKSANIILYLLTWLSFISANLHAEYTPQNQLDLNNASLEEIRLLPVKPEIAQKLYERILYKGPFESIYELLEIQGIDQYLFNAIKPLIRIEPFRPKTSWEEKAEEIYYQLDRWSGNEGINDTFVDLWIEKALNPMNVNTVRFDELINLQNVSPIDAVSIIRYRDEIGNIRSSRDLREVPGLSYYGYRNARNFLEYESQNKSDHPQWRGFISARMDNTPFFTDEDVASAEANIESLEESQTRFSANTLPNMYTKIRLTYNQKFKFGFSYTRNLNEPDFYYNSGDFRIPKGKFYFGIEDVRYNNILLRKLYIGNYTVSIGQGVIMENTDFFVPRKSGYGFRKRFNGISGDNSRTRQYALKGIAAHLEYKDLSAIIFGSFTSRDAILNRQISDSTSGRGFNQLIVLDQRFRYAPDDAERNPENMNLSWLNSVRELTYGFNLQYNFVPGTFAGITYYESAYDRPLEPYIEEIVNAADMSRLVTADNEIRTAYGFGISRGTNPLWKNAVSFRRVYGFNFQTVFENISIQGEWGELDKGGEVYKLGDDPRALVLSVYTQFNNFNILMLYRDYDLDYDNPYQRSFSNYRRFKGTIFEDYYYLQSSLYGQLYANAAQPQSERGYYLNTYYQINRNLTTRIEYDNWTRNSDQAPQFRLVGTVDIRPIFPVRIQLRQKWQARDKENDLTLNYFENFEFRGRLDLRLSGYNNFNLIYVRGRLLVHPRPRVFGDMTPLGEAIGSGITHNFNHNLKLRAFVGYYKGFFWNFEDTQFVVLDSQRGALRTWWSLYARLNNNFSLRFKYTFDYQHPLTNIAFSDVRNPESGRFYGTDRLRKQNSYYYLEFNYNF
jgi:DNA uptake protein ComE-like DNA-binding protein